MDASTLTAAAFLIAGIAAGATTIFTGDAPVLRWPRSRRAAPRFACTNTLFLIGPDARARECAMQRRLLKPGVAALISRNIAIVEIYGEAAPMRNGARLAEVDGALLRVALGAPDGFRLIFVDATGRTTLYRDAPASAADVLASAGFLRSAAALDRNAPSLSGARPRQARIAAA